MKICLDAGHYGKYNRSPVNGTYWESEMTWKLHLMLKEELERYGVEIITTRSDQTKDLGLVARGRKAAGCDLFISVHSNAVNGSETTDYPLACCCVSGACDVLGLRLAQAVQRTMGCKQSGRITKKRNTAGNADWYSVLYGAAQVGVPGILLENGFHTNRANTAWLLDDANLRRLAVAEAATIAAYYGLLEQGTHTSAASTAQNTPGEGFLVRVICADLNVRNGSGTEYPVTVKVHKNEVYTIVETAKAKDGGTWGRLKSGAGWINIGERFCKRV